MNNFIRRIQFFMQDRYGVDELNIALLALSFIISIISRFVFHWQARLVIQLVSLAFVILFILRFLSKNIDARAREDAKFRPIFKNVTGWFKFQYKRLRDGRTHRYYHCPSCKAQLRVKNIKGKHTIRCPKCGAQFEKKIR